ncbi:MAG: glycosyltransferase family 1 protein, partial [Actinomycetota bacterium]|nr:glycosyltransferase family 1 protein [Actinomycetota bacterium]
TPAVGYDVPGLRDSLAAHGGAAVAPSPGALAAWVALVLTGGASLTASPGEGAVLPWGEVAGRLLALASAGAAR